MDVARDVIELFSVKDPARAREIANKLDQLNGDRQEEERRILQSITAHFEEQPALRDAFCIVIDGEGWHRGVIGITATRVVERYGRPALVISQQWRGGARLGPFHPRISPAECARVLRRPVHALRRTRPRCRLLAAVRKSA